MELRRDYVKMEVYLLPTSNIIRCSFTICPCWRKDGRGDYVESWLDDLSGYVYSMLCDLVSIAECDMDVISSYEEFVASIIPLNVSGMVFSDYDFYTASCSKTQIEEIIKSVFKEDFVTVGHLSEHSLVIGKMLLDYLEQLELD